MISESLLKKINRGREGRNQGLSMGLPKYEGIVDGVCKEMYTMLFSTSGSGKSSLALFAYVYKPLKDHLEDGKFKVSYFSLEMAKDMIFAKLLCLHLFDEYGVNISVKQLLSRQRNFILNDELYQLVNDSIPWLNKVEKIVTVYDKTCNADYLYENIMNELRERGRFDKVGNSTIYVPNDPDIIHEVVIDHISLVKPRSGKSLKEEIDAVSSNLVVLRNTCGISPLVIMQTNRNSSDMERRKQGLMNLTLNDVKDSGNPKIILKCNLYKL